jgi:hypothetical protein
LSPHLIAREQFGRGSANRLILEIDIRKLLAGAVRYDEGGTNVLDSPGRREAASSAPWPAPGAASKLPAVETAEEGLNVSFLCLGLPQLALLKVRFLRLAF